MSAPRRPVPLPTGTVTFLFTDMEGSTRLAQGLGTADWPPVLERHRALIRTAIAAHGGIEVETEGDGFFVAFDRAGAAIAAAADAQRALAAEPWSPDASVRVRMGIHTGDGRLDADGDYVGTDVHRAARVAAAGHGGQVLVSATTRALVGNDLPAGVTSRDLGEHRLKDLDEPVVLHQLVIDDLPSTFPALRTLDTPTNLPVQLTSFLGREREISEILRLLAEARLLTLTGSGGTGKTRLAIEVGRRALDRYPDGVWFVALGSIREPDLVASTIAQELGLADRGGRDPLARLTDHLRGRRALIILDNFEQVTAAAGVARTLIGACPSVDVLVTSRSALHVSGEREFPVPPLGVPDPRHLPDLATLSQFEAVALFIERARAVRPGFSVTNESAPPIAEICYRLDGLPLAIELAAARIKLLTPQAILARFDDRLSLLAGGARDLPERQQTLRGAIAWSHDMLDAPDRTLFACLSVFSGGADLESIDAVCGPDLPSGDAFDGLASLVDKSLVRQVEGLAGEPRFTMLGTIREFAAEQLAGEEDGAVRERHAARYAELASSAAADIMGAGKRQLLDLLEQEHDNLRAAIGWATETGRAETALRLAADLWRFWQMRGYLAEGRDRTERAIALPHAADHPEALMAALEAAGGLSYWQNDGPASARWYSEALALARSAGDLAGEANALYNLTFGTIYLRAPLDPASAAEKSQQGRVYAMEALDIYRRLGDRAGEARALWAISNTYWGSAETPEAAEYARDALAIFRELGDTFQIAWSQYTLALYDLRIVGEAAAAERLAEALRIFGEASDVTGYVLVMDAVAFLASRTGDHQTAARLSGAVADLERRTGTGLGAPNRDISGWEPEVLRDDPATAAAYAEGTQLSPEDAVAAARAWLADYARTAVGR
jgi:predicted ATPase/class 3 adenylate cyclase